MRNVCFRVRNVRGGLFVALLAATASAVAAPRPDFLFIMPDQMRGDCLSVLNHRTVRTPTMDALANSGVLFRHAYTEVPSCVPARFILHTGLSPSASGIVGFAARTIKEPTFPGLLREAGYETYMIGRYQHQDNTPDLGYTHEVRGTTYINTDAYADFFRSVVPTAKSPEQWYNSNGWNVNLWPAKAWSLDDAWHPTHWVVEQSLKVVEEAPEDKPLFLMSSYLAPHPPLFPTKEHWDNVMARNKPEAGIGDWVDWDSAPEDHRKCGARHRFDQEQLAKTQAGYFGLIEHLDAEIARLIHAFTTRCDRVGRPWVIILTTDHGEMLGDHHYFRKCEPYEGSAHIPYIITGSSQMGFKAGLQATPVVGLQDLMPTILALADVPCPDVTGINLVPTLQGKEQKVRDWLHFEHATCYSTNQAFHAMTDGHFKYIWRSATGQEQLFNLDADPTECRDLAAVPAEAERLALWRNRLIEALTPRHEGFIKDGKLQTGKYPIGTRPLPFKKDT